MPIADVLERTSWKLLSEQKLALLKAISAIDESPKRDDAMSQSLEGLLHWVDAMQDAAAEAGYPVVFLDLLD